MGSGSNSVGLRRLDAADGSEWRRCVQVMVRLRPVEAAELRRHAQEWGVPVSTALWALATAEMRRRSRRASPETERAEAATR